jgi:hypothetical protein
MQDLLCIRNLSLLGGIALSLAVQKLICTVARAYYMLRVRAGVPTVMWWPRFWRIDPTQQRGSSLKRVVPRMQQLGGKHGLYGTVYGALLCVLLAVELRLTVARTQRRISKAAKLLMHLVEQL